MFTSRANPSLTLCDLTKSFNIVTHDLLLTKLKSFGVEGQALETLASYLRDRRQVVSSGGAVSKQRVVKHAVPQALVVGPLLFLVLESDLGEGQVSLLFPQ